MKTPQLSLGLEEAASPPPALPSYFDPTMKPIEPGITLIEASAGTGKTHSIVITVLRLLLERRPDGGYWADDISRILVVTFTIAATNDLITRLRRALRTAVDVFSGADLDPVEHGALFELHRRHGAEGRGRLTEALAHIDQLSVFTIHAFCRRVLEENALESATPHDFTFVDDEQGLLQLAAHDWWRRTVAPNDRLAMLAVELEWTPTTFLDDLGKARRYPDTHIVPDESLDDALADVARGMAKISKAWNEGRVWTLLDRLEWKADAPFRTQEARARLARRMAAIPAGNWAGAIALLRHCTPDAVRLKMKQRPAADHDTVQKEAFFLACEKFPPVAAALRIALRASFIRSVERAFEQEKRRRHALGFDDLLRRVHQGVTGEGALGHLATAIRARYDAALIDEFQDTDGFQYPIFAAAFRDRPLFLIGDPKQAIYGFRGADISVYLDAVRDADQRLTLRNNHRSTPALVTAFNALFRRAREPFLHADSHIGYVDVTAAKDDPGPLAGDPARSLCWWLVGMDGGKTPSNTTAEERFHDAIAREIKRLLSAGVADGGMVHPRDIAILVRSNREATVLQGRLRDAGVHSVLHGSGDIMLSEEMADLGRVLTAVATPSNTRAMRAAFTTTLWGMDAARLYELSRPEYEHEWQEVVQSLADARETWRRHGFMRMVQELLARQSVPERLLRLRDGERRLTNLRHAIEVLHNAEEEERLSPDGLLSWLAHARASKPTNTERRELRLESDADAVQISTIHSSKGLEYGVIFCTSLWNSRPEPKASAGDAVLVRREDGTVVYDLGSEDWPTHAGLAAAEELAEGLRLAYVAVTRARNRVYLGLAATASAARSPLGYLLRPPDAVALEPRADLVARVAEAVALAMPQWHSTLASLCASAGGAMSWNALGPVAAQPAVAGGAEPALPVPRARDLSLGDGQLDTWRISSYTRLSRGRPTHDEPELDAHEVDPDAIAEAADSQPTGFMAFPKGKHPGIVLHSIFEQLDFAASESESMRALVEAQLAGGRLALRNAAATCDDVCQMLVATVGARLPGTGFRLRDVAPDAAKREWRFHLPLARVTREALLAPFAHAASEPARSYAHWISSLDTFDVHGFLTGSVDLLFRHDGRWYVVDWKSNDLGATPSCYERPELERAMFTSHYTLQYHLYVLALHRFLRSRLPDYDYDRDVGGVWYAFLRGIDGESERGWYHDRPPRAIIAALDAALLESPGG